jgi:hypothetical protein
MRKSEIIVNRAGEAEEAEEAGEARRRTIFFN